MRSWLDEKITGRRQPMDAGEVKVFSGVQGVALEARESLTSEENWLRIDFTARKGCFGFREMLPCGRD